MMKLFAPFILLFIPFFLSAQIKQNLNPWHRVGDLNSKRINSQGLPNNQFEPQKTASFIGQCLGYDYYASGTTPGSYVLAAKADYLYDTSGYMVRTLNLNFNGSSWVPTSKDTVIYDANGNVVSRELFIASGGIYTPLQRLDYTYNTLNLVTEQLVSSWVNGQYVAQTKFENYYSGSLLDSTKRYSDQGGGLSLLRVTKNTFDGNGNVIQEKIYEMQAGIRVLMRTNYRVYTNGLLAIEYQETYFGFVPDTTGIGTYAHDANGNDTLIYFEQIDSTGVLMPNSRQRTTWDVNNNETGLTLEFYQNGMWDLFFESRTGVDLNFDASDIMYPPELTEGFRVNNKLEWLYNYLNLGATLQEDSLVYRYNSFISVAELEHEMNIKISPNPFVDVLMIESIEPITAEVISLTGQIVASKEFMEASEEWDLNGLPAGMYVLRISNGSQVETTQIIKQ